MIEKILKKEYQRLLNTKTRCELRIKELPKGSIVYKKNKKVTYHYLVFRESTKVIFQYLGKDSEKTREFEKKIFQRKKHQVILREVNRDLKLLEKYSGENMLIKKITEKIKKAVSPDKIILFGSYAAGKKKEDSDLDILVIMNSSLPRYKRSVPIYKALAGIFIPKDIVVYTPEEVEEWKNVSQAFVTSAISKGKVLYAKK
jgi:predicted nucleotidyltransferase